MSRYIDADLLKENHLMSDDCNNCEQNPIACEYDYEYTKKDFCEWIDNEPTADVRENVHGEWVLEHSSQLWECTNCHEREIRTTDFCPNCGADMRGEKK